MAVNDELAINGCSNHVPPALKPMGLESNIRVVQIIFLPIYRARKRMVAEAHCAPSETCSR